MVNKKGLNLSQWFIEGVYYRATEMIAHRVSSETSNEVDVVGGEEVTVVVVWKVWYGKVTNWGGSLCVVVEAAQIASNSRHIVEV